MRILYITDVYFPRVNGVSTSIQTFRRELQSLGHEVTLICPGYGEITDDEVDIIRIPARTVIVDPEDRMMKIGRIIALAEELSARQLDLIHIHTPFVAHYAGIKLARLLGLPVIETYHTYFEQYLFNYIPWLPAGILRYLARGFSRKQCNEVDTVIVPSQPMQDVLSSYGVKSPLHVLPTGIDLGEFAEGDGGRFRVKYNVDPGRPVIAYVGRLALEKNVHFLIDVLHRVKQDCPHILLILAGEGPARNDLRSMAKAKNLAQNILFVGNLNRGAELNDCYSAADIFVFASRTETQGLVLLEAMALGIPVVSTAEMGTRDVLSDGCGCIIAEENIDSFTSKILWLLRNPVQRGLLADAGNSYVHKWTAATITERVTELYNRVIMQKEMVVNEVVIEKT